ncbi:uncharacterized protein LOC112552962 [Pogonomyrmex barbatus]|uniref:Uncharacterized protein LOC112552962 n=1 Tax=Pogonomyrmex barbatus TaxID=144034 RepID=A0A8N1S927_9HYME|nr:uncharacterized protein LOC112552962 [Pogonomyrmex barbatus]
MKISRRYLSPEKPRPRPYFDGHKSINKERTRALPKRMFEVQIPTLPCSERQRADEGNSQFRRNDVSSLRIRPLAILHFSPNRNSSSLSNTVHPPKRHAPVKETTLGDIERTEVESI